MPYEWQERFHRLGATCPQRLLMTGNRCGKTFSGGAEFSYHVTGKYPEDWKGHRFKGPLTNAWAAGVSNVKTRDIVQKELFGEPKDPKMLGTGTIPKEDIVETIRLPGVPNAFSGAVVKHYDENGVHDGNSMISFLSYEMGFEKFMGDAVELIWLDEQPAQDIFAQAVLRILDKKGIMYMTFTPETGMTPVVKDFMENLQEGQALVRAGWKDCPHFDKDRIKQALAALPPHLRDKAMNGDPVFGSGLVFITAEEQIGVEPFDIPSTWKRLCAIDFGFDHPCALVWLTQDPNTGIIYLYDSWRKSEILKPLIAAEINGKPYRPPVIWPHDGEKRDPGTGITVAQQYRDLGVNMSPRHFHNPIAPGDPKKGNQKVEPGIEAMSNAFELGTFKVFKTEEEWFEEYRNYHREKGKIYPVDDDLMSATRYGYQSFETYAQVCDSSDYFYNPSKQPDYDLGAYV